MAKGAVRAGSSSWAEPNYVTNSKDVEFPSIIHSIIKSDIPLLSEYTVMETGKKMLVAMTKNEKC